ncbi:MAG TPA: cysteine desulfurase, partial [Deltaproteobacteria bacterium]|nr:cysteine desulfurase [Deltaproteobacteria bacterium]
MPGPAIRGRNDVRIYLDHNATTPIRPEVIESMSEVLQGGFGNPSSVHAEGAAARARVESARAEVADLLGVEAGEVQLTGGATESNNTVLFGCLEPGDHVVTTRIEHPSIDACLRVLEARGVRVDRVVPDANGRVDAGEMLAAIGGRTRLVSMIWANNETGAVQPVAEVAEGCRERGVLFHTDATQALGKAVVDLRRVPCDLLSCSAHKLGGPKGVGALIRRRGCELPPFLHGGGQESGRRGGTENVIGIVGFGRACSLAKAEGASRIEAWARLRDRLWQEIRSQIDDARWNGDPDRTL